MIMVSPFSIYHSSDLLCDTHLFMVTAPDKTIATLSQSNVHLNSKLQHSRSHGGEDKIKIFQKLIFFANVTSGGVKLYVKTISK